MYHVSVNYLLPSIWIKALVATGVINGCERVYTAYLNHCVTENFEKCLPFSLPLSYEIRKLFSGNNKRGDYKQSSFLKKTFIITVTVKSLYIYVKSS